MPTHAAHAMDPDAVKTIFFDAAGTLFHVREPVGETYARIGRAHGFAMEPTKTDVAFRQAWQEAPRIGYRSESNPAEREAADRAWWEALVKRTVALSAGRHSEAGSSRFADYFQALYLHFGRADAWKLYPEVPALLSRLRGRYRLAILSNFDARLETVAGGLGLAAMVDAVYYSTRLGAVKPDPALFRAALRAAGAEAGTTLHVGDDPEADHRGARDAGLGSVVLDRRREDLGAALKNLLFPGD